MISHTRETFKKLFALLNWREKRSFAILVLALVVEAVFEMIAVAVIPFYISLLAFPDDHSGHGITAQVFLLTDAVFADRHSAILWASGVLLGFFTLKASFSVLSTYLKARFAQNRARKLSTRLFSAYLHAPYTFHLQNNSSDLLRNINNECSLLPTRVILPMVEMVSQSLILIGVIAVVVWFVPPLVLLWLIAFLAGGMLFATRLQKRTRRLGIEAQQQRGQIVRAVNEGLGGLREIRLLNRAGVFAERLDQAMARVLMIQRTVQVFQKTNPAVIETLGIIGLLGVTVMLVAEDSSSQRIVETLSVFAVAMARMKGSVRGFIHGLSEVRHNGVSLDVIYTTLHDLEPYVAQYHAQGDQTRLEFEHSIRFDAISYRYPQADRDALQGIDLEVTKGEVIGIVGETGSGKSSLIDVLTGLLEPTAGKLLVDGKPAGPHISAWQRNLGYVPQLIFLIDGTVRGNIALGLGDEEVNAEQLDFAVKAAQLEPLLERLADGLETMIGEGGVRLSGGERQRIAVARALYHQPQVLIFDEATSALDNTTEAALVSAIQALKGRQTIFMIAHRLTTVRHCDQIVFMRDATIDAVGSFDELASKHAAFKRMLAT